MVSCSHAHKTGGRRCHRPLTHMTGNLIFWWGPLDYFVAAVTHRKTLPAYHDVACGPN